MTPEQSEHHARFRPRVLGRTNLAVGAMGISASYGVPAAGVEKAFEHGVNYLYWGSIRRKAFGDAVRSLMASAGRDRIVLVIQSYSRSAALMRMSLERALRQLKADRADILLLGYWNHAIAPRLIDAARDLKRCGLARFLGISTHNRGEAPSLAQTPDIDVLHVRYNAAHRGAETEIFPLVGTHRGSEDPRGVPGIVAFTATSWGQLLNPNKVPRGERVPTAADCYRFALSNPAVHLCMSGPKTREHVKDVIAAIERGPMSEEELGWMRRIGDAIHGE